MPDAQVVRFPSSWRTVPSRQTAEAFVQTIPEGFADQADLVSICERYLRACGVTDPNERRRIVCDVVESQTNGPSLRRIDGSVDMHGLQCRIDQALAFSRLSSEGEGHVPGWGRVMRYWDRRRGTSPKAPEQATVHCGEGVEMPVQDLFEAPPQRCADGPVVRFARGSLRFAVVVVSAFLGGK